MPPPLVPLLCALALAPLACGDEEADESAPKPAADRSESAVAGGCADVEAPRPRADGGATRPEAGLDQDKSYDVTLATSCGDIVIRLDQRTSPHTAASFAELARSGFYDDTVFHRIVPGFVIQGGDPTGSGTGGPGYTTRDEPPADARYVRGTVAMAKTAAEPPGTAGSQFYIVTGADARLPAEYALLGEVVRGLGTIERIGRLGDPASGEAGTPLKPVVIETASVHAG
jgi:cyclophilin family peptidyl-prolyl cis-trans isomerase